MLARLTFRGPRCGGPSLRQPCFQSHGCHSPGPLHAAEGDPKLALEKLSARQRPRGHPPPGQDRAAGLVNVWYHVGSGDETPGKSGFAHLFEHMMFQGSKHVGEDKHFEILQKIGASSDQRHHQHRPHQLLRGGARQPARDGAVARERPHGLPAAAADREEPRQPARRRAQRAAPALRQRPLRQGPLRARPAALPRGPPLPLPDHRPARGPGGRLAGRREGLLPQVVRARRTRPC